MEMCEDEIGVFVLCVCVDVGCGCVMCKGYVVCGFGVYDVGMGV